MKSKKRGKIKKDGIALTQITETPRPLAQATAVATLATISFAPATSTGLSISGKMKSF